MNINYGLYYIKPDYVPFDTYGPQKGPTRLPTGSYGHKIIVSPGLEVVHVELSATDIQRQTSPKIFENSCGLQGMPCEYPLRFTVLALNWGP